MVENKNKDFVLVIDVESCCWIGKTPKNQYKEIIEIGISCVDFFTKEIIENRSIIVKPQFSDISEFCTRLTSLTYEYVEKNGISFKKACKILEKEYNSTKKIWFSWGEYDKFAFEKECEIKKVKYPLSKKYVNLQDVCAFKYGMKQMPSVAGFLKKIDMGFEGTPHRGISDSYNTAKILQKII